MPETTPPTSSAPGTDTPARTGETPTDHLVTTHHTLETPGGPLRYTARTGRIVLREEEIADDVFEGWTPRAELAITAYTLDGADPATRPVAFAFNGGPGSPSMYLHLGLLGPRRVDLGEPGAPVPPPYRLADNPQTLLGDADLVFIDPISTGQSRAVQGGKPKDFHSYAKDIEQVTELIRLWCTREDRWMSPKFVLGESYGTIRGVAVAERLQSKYGMALNGLVLISSVLDFATLDFGYLRSDDACVNTFPTYAALAHYHGKHPGRSLAEVLAEAEEYAGGHYAWALRRGHRLTEAERTEVAAEVARLTGLSPAYVEATDLRPEHWRFCTELLREQGLSVGRIDGRVTGPLVSRIAENMDADPSMDALAGPYGAAIHHYLRGELGLDLDLPYEVLGITTWHYAEFEGKPIGVTDKLERLLRANPHLRVRVEYGYYDVATPYYAALDVMAHLRLPRAALDRIEHAFFEAGHMPYWGESTRVAEADGIADFVRRATTFG